MTQLMVIKGLGSIHGATDYRHFNEWLKLQNVSITQVLFIEEFLSSYCSFLSKNKVLNRPLIVA